MHAIEPGMDGGRLRWMVHRQTLNQLVEGSSPSRLTKHRTGKKGQSRASRRGSSVLVAGSSVESMRTNDE